MSIIAISVMKSERLYKFLFDPPTSQNGVVRWTLVEVGGAVSVKSFENGEDDDNKW